MTAVSSQGCRRTRRTRPWSLCCSGLSKSAAEGGPRSCRCSPLSPVFELLKATWGPSQQTYLPGPNCQLRMAWMVPTGRLCLASSGIVNQQSFSLAAAIDATISPVFFFALESLWSEVFFSFFTALTMRLIWLIENTFSPQAASTNGLMSFWLFPALARA